MPCWAETCSTGSRSCWMGQIWFLRCAKSPPVQSGTSDSNPVGSRCALGARPGAGGVEGFEPVAVLGDHVAAADLHGRGQLLRLELEGAAEQQERLDPLGLAHGL